MRVSVVRASSGVVLATLVTNYNTGANLVSLWKAADFTTVGSFATGPFSNPFGAASDGVNFWITFYDEGRVARF